MCTYRANFVYHTCDNCVPKHDEKTGTKTPKTLDNTGFFDDNPEPQKNLIGTVSIVSTVYAAPARLTRRPSVRKIIEKGNFLLQAKKNRLKEIRRQKGGATPK